VVRGSMDYTEDKLFPLVYPLVKKVHGIPDDAAVQRHARLKGHEVDVYVTWRDTRGLRGGVRTYSLLLELKVWDIPKLVKQLLARRELAMWVYGVTALYTREWLKYALKRPQDVRALIDAGIGVITFAYNDVPVVLLESKVRPRYLIDYYLKGGIRFDSDQTT